MQAVDSLSTLFEDDDLITRITPFIVDIVNEIIKYTPHMNSQKFFDIICEIVRNYAEVLAREDDVIVLLAEALCKKGIEEYELLSNKQKSTKIIINKIWNSLRHLSEKEEYIPKF